MEKAPHTASLRQQLLAGILIPVALFVVIDTFSLYRQALAAVNIAYDRTLLASAKAIGERLQAVGDDATPRLQALIPYTALEPFEADNRSRMAYRVSDATGQWIDGEKDLTLWQGKLPDQGPYAALVDFYDDTLRGDPVRVAVLLQPVAHGRVRTMATVQVAETLQLRQTLARQILLDTLQRQAVLISVITLVVFLVVHRVTTPIRRLSSNLRQRSEENLHPIEAPDLPREIRPLMDATNQVMLRLQHLLNHQKRFVRDAAHQLRTPLAVLKVQVQSALRGDVPATSALADILKTVDRSILLTNQMLALAKVEQVRQQGDYQQCDWAELVRSVALDLSPLIADKNLDFEFVATPCPVWAHEWMLRELVLNLLHNAIRHTPPDQRLLVTIGPDMAQAQLVISDSGPGISEELRLRLFQPFSSGNTRSGSGLGLVIAQEIAQALGGSIQLNNRYDNGHLHGLNACVCLPISPLRSA